MLAGAVVAALLAVACGGNGVESSAPKTGASPSVSEPSAKTPAGSVKQPGDAKVGDTARCPVSGEEFTVEATSPKSEHDGKTYFFCCNGCRKKFEADPQKYLKKS